MSHPRYGLAWLTTILSRAQSRAIIGEPYDHQPETTQSTGYEGYRTLKLRALMWLVRRLMARAERLAREGRR